MRILIAVDEPACIKEIGKFIQRHYWNEGTEIRVINALAPLMMDYAMAAYPLYLDSVEKDLEEAASKILQQAQQEFSNVKGVTVKTETQVGIPTMEILSAARSWPADLIIVGSHVRTGFDKFFTGSISQEIAANAPCSVVVLRLNECEHQRPKERKKAEAAIK